LRLRLHYLFVAARSNLVLVPAVKKNATRGLGKIDQRISGKASRYGSRSQALSLRPPYQGHYSTHLEISVPHPFSGPFTDAAQTQHAGEKTQLNQR
jgi:hypothetical protein